MISRAKLLATSRLRATVEDLRSARRYADTADTDEEAAQMHVQDAMFDVIEAIADFLTIEELE